MSPRPAMVMAAVALSLAVWAVVGPCPVAHAARMEPLDDVDVPHVEQMMMQHAGRSLQAIRRLGDPPLPPPPPPGAPGNIPTGMDQIDMWKKIQKRMWDVLLVADFDDVCKDASACPCPSDLDGSGSNRNIDDPKACMRYPLAATAACGGIARVWLRILFHDCGTFDKNAKTGGCNGSIRYELTRSENPFAATLQFYEQIYADYRNKTQFPKPWPKPPTMADIVVLGSFLGLAKCKNSPTLRFRPGRVDATAADGVDLLPGRDEGFASINAKMSRANLTAAEMVAVIGAGHTVAALDGEKLDATPSNWDNQWAKGLLSNTNPFTLNSDKALLTDGSTQTVVQQFADDNNVFKNAAMAALDKLSWLGQTPPPPPPGGH